MLSSAVCTTICVVTLELCAGGTTASSLKGSSPLRWLPLALLAVYAALDCLVQYTLAATDATSVLHIPPEIVNFVRVNFSVKLFV